MPALFPRQFTARALVAAKIEDIDEIELLLQGCTEAVHRACVQPSGVGDERDNSFAAFQPIRRPAGRLDVAVINSIYIRGCRPLRVRPRNRRLKLRIVRVLRIVVRGFLPDGIRRVADDDADGRLALALHARGVLLKALRLEDIPLLVKFEGICKADALEWSVGLRRSLSPRRTRPGRANRIAQHKIREKSDEGGTSDFLMRQPLQESGDKNKSRAILLPRPAPPLS